MKGSGKKIPRGGFGVELDGERIWAKIIVGEGGGTPWGNTPNTLLANVGAKINARGNPKGRQKGKDESGQGEMKQ